MWSSKNAPQRNPFKCYFKRLVHLFGHARRQVSQLPDFPPSGLKAEGVQQGKKVKTARVPHHVTTTANLAEGERREEVRGVRGRRFCLLGRAYKDGSDIK